MNARSLQSAAALCVLFCFQNAASAGLVISFYEDAGNVWMSLSGTGTVPTGVGNPGSSLEFLNFTGTPFPGVADAPYMFGSSTLAATAGGANLTINGVQLISDIANQSDLILMLSGNISQGDSYTFSGSAIVTGLTLAQLAAGVYTPLGANGNQGDQDAFAPVSLSIAAASVPEPAGLAMMCVAVLGACVAGVRCRRRNLGLADEASPLLS
jgi:hypothetical protein